MVLREETIWEMFLHLPMHAWSYVVWFLTAAHPNRILKSCWNAEMNSFQTLLEWVPPVRAAEQQPSKLFPTPPSQAHSTLAPWVRILLMLPSCLSCTERLAPLCQSQAEPLPCSNACLYGGTRAVVKLWAWPQVSFTTFRRSQVRFCLHSTMTMERDQSWCESFPSWSSLEKPKCDDHCSSSKNSCRLLGHMDTLIVMASVLQVCRAKELPAGEDTGGSCNGHSGMLSFERQRMQPRKGFVSVNAGRRIK